MSAPRTLDDVISDCDDALYGNEHNAAAREDAIRAACEEHAANETARLRMELACAKPLYSRRQLEDRHAQMRAAGEALATFFSGECECPCCGEAEECLPDCTFAEDCPLDAEGMDATRAALAAWREALR
ncbi:MAG: hypothetical protein WC273_10655 [Dehalococcoidia bacterium]